MQAQARWQGALRFGFWILWALMIGGVASAGILAPLGFRTVPGLLPPEAAAQSHAVISLLFTLFFERFFPACVWGFLLLALLEQRTAWLEWPTAPKRVLLRQGWLLVGLGVWAWLGYGLVPEMAAAVQDPTRWGQAEVREAFRAMHDSTGFWVQAGTLLTLLLPWVSGVSGLRGR